MSKKLPKKLKSVRVTNSIFDKIKSEKISTVFFKNLAFKKDDVLQIFNDDKSQIVYVKVLDCVVRDASSFSCHKNELLDRFGRLDFTASFITLKLTEQPAETLTIADLTKEEQKLLSFSKSVLETKIVELEGNLASIKKVMSLIEE